jgi:autotransporter-associated beta strand protein
VDRSDARERVGSLFKTGSGANTFSGTTTISGGTLELGNPLALQNSTLSYAYSGGLSFGSLTTTTTLGESNLQVHVFIILWIPKAECRTDEFNDPIPGKLIGKGGEDALCSPTSPLFPRAFLCERKRFPAMSVCGESTLGFAVLICSGAGFMAATFKQSPSLRESLRDHDSSKSYGPHYR